MTAVQAALSGALIGGLYALMAAGLSVTWGVLRVINLAHFGLILLGAYLTYQMSTTWGLDPILTVLVSAPVLFVLGAALQWAYDRFDIAEFNSLLVSFGLLMIAIEVATRIWTADFRQIAPAGNPYGTSALHLGPIALPTSGSWPSRSRCCSSAAVTSRCNGPSRAAACAPSPRTARSPPRSASTTAGSASWSAVWPGSAPPSPAWSSP